MSDGAKTAAGGGSVGFRVLLMWLAGHDGADMSAEAGPIIGGFAGALGGSNRLESESSGSAERCSSAEASAILVPSTHTHGRTFRLTRDAPPHVSLLGAHLRRAA